MWLLMVNHSIKEPIGILYDVLVKVKNFIFLVDFIILDHKVKFEVPIILGRLLLSTGMVLVYIEQNELKLRLSNEKVKFVIYQSMK